MVRTKSDAATAEFLADLNKEECSICNEGGEVICCDTCPLVFHQHCLKLKHMPDGEWQCPNCVRP